MAKEAVATTLDEYWSAVKQVIGTAWPEIAGKFFRETSIERKNWINMIETGDIGEFWCVATTKFAPATEYGPSPKIAITTDLYYIMAIKDADIRAQLNGQIINNYDWLLQKLMVLKSALFMAQTLGTIDDQVTFDVSAENQINQVFLTNNYNYQAAMITFTSLAVPIL